VGVNFRLSSIDHYPQNGFVDLRNPTFLFTSSHAQSVEAVSLLAVIGWKFPTFSLTRWHLTLLMPEWVLLTLRAKISIISQIPKSFVIFFVANIRIPYIISNRLTSTFVLLTQKFVFLTLFW